MSRACLLGTSILALLFASLAQAGENQERAARKACLSGDYAKGVEILSDLYLDSKNPTHIYNQARCYEQNNHCSEAVGRFREYLRKAPDLKNTERHEVERHIEDCEALLGKAQVPATPMPAPSPAALQATAPAPVTPVSNMVAPPTDEHVTAEASTGKSYGLVIAGVCSGLVGLGAIGAGLYYYDRAKFYSKEASKPNPPAGVDDDGRHAENMQWILFGLGGTALATGTLLTILGWPSSSSSTASLAPMLAPGLAGIAAQGVF